MTTATTTRSAARLNPLTLLVLAIALAASFTAGAWTSSLGRTVQPDVASAPAPTPTFDAVQFRAEERAPLFAPIQWSRRTPY